MKALFLAILAISLLTNCNNSNNKKADKPDRIELVAEPDKPLRGEYEKQNELIKTACVFSEPDTSVALNIHRRMTVIPLNPYCRLPDVYTSLQTK